MTLDNEMGATIGGAVKLLARKACGNAFCAAVWVFVLPCARAL